LIIPSSELNDAERQFQEAETLSKELLTLQDGLLNARQFLQKGDSCSAVGILFRITKEKPRGKKALSVFEDAEKLQKDAMILCAERIAEEGYYQRARTMLQPYASNNEPAQRAIKEFSELQHEERSDRVREKKEAMVDLKKEDRRWSLIGVVASILVGILLLLGVGIAFFGQISTAIFSSLSSIIPGIVVLLYYNRSDKIRTERIKLIQKNPAELEMELEVMRQATGLTDKSKENSIIQKPKS
jgi:hypothetical protein